MRSTALIAWGVAIASTAACAPTFSVPEGGVLLCKVSEDCPGAMKCASDLRRCVEPGYVPDLTGPALVQATATSATGLLVIFDEPLDLAALAVPGNFALNGGLTVDLATPRPDERSVLLSTSPQARAAVYTLTVSNLSDRVGNPMSPDSGVIDFSGFGTLPSDAAPALLAPNDGTRSFPDEPLVFVWAVPEGNDDFVFQLAVEPTFTEVALQATVKGSLYRFSPADLAAPRTALTPRSWFWRVRSLRSTFSAARRLVVEDRERVYVDDGAPAASGGPAYGNRSEPFASIQQAVLRAAETTPPRQVAIAEGSYQQAVVLVPDATLEGGWRPGATPDEPWVPAAGTSTLRAPLDTNSTVVAAGAHRATVRRLIVRNDTLADKVVALRVLGSRDLRVEDVTLLGGPGTSFIGAAAANVDSSPGMTFLRTVVVGGGGGAAARGITVSNSTGLRLEGCDIQATPPGHLSTTEAAGVALEFVSDFTIVDSKIQGGQAVSPWSTAAIELRYSAGLVARNVLAGANFDNGGRPYETDWSRAIAVFSYSPFPRPSAELHIVNNLLFSNGASGAPTYGWSAGVDVPNWMGWTSCVPATLPVSPGAQLDQRLFVHNNTFVLESDTGAGRMLGLRGLSSCVDARNNLLVSLTTATEIYLAWQDSQTECAPSYPNSVWCNREEEPTLGTNAFAITVPAALNKQALLIANRFAAGTPEQLRLDRDLDGDFSDDLGGTTPVSPHVLPGNVRLLDAANIFVDAGMGDFRTQPSQTVLDTGENLSTHPRARPEWSIDLAGQRRPDAGLWKIGAWR